ncbi:MAG: hypothetical protein ABSB74_06110 [Tepidisphaeraceae bacterium]
MNTMSRWVVAMVWVCFSCGAAFGQAEVSGWGSLRGIRLDGELMAFTTGVRAVGSATPDVDRRGEMLGNAHFAREGNEQICTGGLRMGDPRRGFAYIFRAPNPLGCRMVFEDAGPGAINVDVLIKANVDVKMGGIYFYLHLPIADYSNESGALNISMLSVTGPAPLKARGLRFASPRRQLEMTLDAPREIVFANDRRKPSADWDVCFPLSRGNLAAGRTVHARITFKVFGEVDKTPADLAIDPSRPGSGFDGIGGNFRLQSPGDGPQVQYNLQNLRVAWGRVAMPLNLWQPKEDVDPIQAAHDGKLDKSVREAMEMARTLAQKRIPMISSVWSAPDWALARQSGGQGLFFGGRRRVNPKKWDDLCKSIGSYLEYLKQNYGAEPRLFSFNESNIGIQVLQSPEEHAEAIKRLGAYFASRGLATKMLLGDTGDPTPVDFIDAAMADAKAVKYIGAVSFHSWRGGTVEQFTRWGKAAKKLGLPLVVAEAGTDSNSYAYPNIFLEPWYGLEEISQYVEMCRICQPASILQWQLTENYSLLSGGQSGEPLGPTERFWLLKQLDATPAGSAAIPITCDKPAIIACAFADAKQGVYAVHLVNNGATRPATISGLPSNLKQMQVYVTDAARGMKEMEPLPVSGGTAHVTLDTQSFTTLINLP